MRRVQNTAPYIDRSRLFYAAVFLLIAIIGSYMYFVSEAVVSVVMRKEVETQMGDLATTMSLLEAEYIEVQHSVSSDIATHKGFVVAQNKIFIDTDAETLVSLRN